MSDTAATISDAQRQPPRPGIAPDVSFIGTCDSCRDEGRVFRARYSISGGRTAIRTYCVDWRACDAQGAADVSEGLS